VCQIELSTSLVTTCSIKGVGMSEAVDPYLIEDYIEIASSLATRTQELHGAKILILGGTGFIGSWLTRSLLFINREYDLRIELILATRDLKLAATKFIYWGKDSLKFIELDLAKLGSIPVEGVTHVIHGATSSTKKSGSENEEEVFNSTVNGMKSLIHSKTIASAAPRIVHLSSGAVYGKSNQETLTEIEIPSKPKPNLTNYAQAKLEAERILSDATSEGLVHGANPRLFAFFGPGLVTNEHFAIGNFMDDALNNREICLSGSPMTTRSYLYPTDLVTWILNVLMNPVNRVIHIGSENAISMMNLAEKINDLTNNQGLRISNPYAEVSHYVPSTKETRQIYGTKEIVPLEEGLIRWIKFLEKTN
jgi:nucleoside-diphosphate-sugar epimerase